MKVNDWLRAASGQLQSAGIGTARLDSLVLLEDVTGLDRAALLAEPSRQINTADIEKLKNLLNRRVRHEPLAYVRGKTEFYGREFLITPAVLEPRPESETMIDLLKELMDGSLGTALLPAAARLADVGAGSGALGITAQLELPQLRVELLEIDDQALKVAKKNVDKFTLAVTALRSDLLGGRRMDHDILLCNLPYVPDSHTVNSAARHEPSFAIYGGEDGLEVFRRLFSQVSRLKTKPLYILSESLPPQHPTMTTVARAAGYRQVAGQDFIQVFQIT